MLTEPNPPRIQRRCLQVAPLLGLFMACACVYSDSRLRIAYKPSMSVLTTSSRPVYLARVGDQRKDPSRIGCKRGSFGGESAKLYMEEPVTVWFKQALSRELGRSGLSLASADYPGIVRIEVDLLDLFIEPDKTLFSNYLVVAQINAEVMVQFQNGASFARRFVSLAEDSALVATDGDYEGVMQQALERWMVQAVGDIVNLIESQVSATSASGPVSWALVTKDRP